MIATFPTRQLPLADQGIRSFKPLCPSPSYPPLLIIDGLLYVYMRGFPLASTLYLATHLHIEPIQRGPKGAPMLRVMKSLGSAGECNRMCTYEPGMHLVGHRVIGP